MPQRRFTLGDQTWIVAPSGLVTANSQDEFGLVFTPLNGTNADVRYSRYSPMGSRSREEAFRDLSDNILRELLQQSEPASMTPEGRYGARIVR